MWLKNNNALYKNIVINFYLTDIWKREFVLAKISSGMLQYDKDIQERKDYIADLKVKNFENDLHHTVNSAKIGDLGLLGGYLYTNTDDTQEYPIIKLVLIITNYKRKLINEDTNLSIFIYKNNKCIISLNN